MENNAINVTDQNGKNSKLSLWFTPGNDVFGYLTRSERIVNSIAALLDSDAPVCHFHSKLMQKEPKVGGAWEWHQDYGYWYKNQFIKSSRTRKSYGKNIRFKDCPIEPALKKKYPGFSSRAF